MSGSKIRVPGELFMVSGLFLVAFSISLMVNLGFGISTISSLPYALNLIAPDISFGVWNLMFQTTLYVILVVVTKNVQMIHIVSFIMVILFAALLDLTGKAVSTLPDEPYLSAVLFACGFITMCLGIALMITSKMPLMIIDMFSNNLASHFRISFRRVKTMFDVSCLAVSAAVSMSFLGNLAGIGIGTVLMSILTGTFVQAFGKLLRGRFDARPCLQKRSDVENSDLEGAGAE